MHIHHMNVPGPYVLAWKKGIAVLSAGSVKVSPDPRVQLINGFNLEIREVGPQDSGDYVCQIGTLEPREITHTLEVLEPVDYKPNQPPPKCKHVLTAPDNVRVLQRARGGEERIIGSTGMQSSGKSDPATDVVQEEQSVAWRGPNGNHFDPVPGSRRSAPCRHLPVHSQQWNWGRRFQASRASRALTDARNAPNSWKNMLEVSDPK
ncbi:hypothetical protein D910_12317 [Dendroctonus ponderosae]|uniref:Ig-like domain-containing protein n=1 Tax=Dendroctonus ponderosae TaxID=77166 RepID=U4UPK7_DENPD|nr:hypothetical protein D910_12317 [Dendroctonus ponderosae]